MIKAFEEYTKKLTDNEKRAVPVIEKMLKLRYGKKNAISNRSMRAILAKNNNIEISGGRFRKIINHLIIYAVLPGLMANSKGYYRSKDIDELEGYSESLLGREEAIKVRRECNDAYIRQLKQESKKKKKE